MSTMICWLDLKEKIFFGNKLILKLNFSEKTSGNVILNYQK